MSKAPKLILDLKTIKEELPARQPKGVVMLSEDRFAIEKLKVNKRTGEALAVVCKTKKQRTAVLKRLQSIINNIRTSDAKTRVRQRKFAVRTTDEAVKVFRVK